MEVIGEILKKATFDELERQIAQLEMEGKGGSRVEETEEATYRIKLLEEKSWNAEWLDENAKMLIACSIDSKCAKLFYLTITSLQNVGLGDEIHKYMPSEIIDLKFIYGRSSENGYQSLIKDVTEVFMAMTIILYSVGSGLDECHTVSVDPIASYANEFFLGKAFLLLNHLGLLIRKHRLYTTLTNFVLADRASNAESIVCANLGFPVEKNNNLSDGPVMGSFVGNGNYMSNLKDLVLRNVIRKIDEYFEIPERCETVFVSYEGDLRYIQYELSCILNDMDLVRRYACKEAYCVVKSRPLGLAILNDNNEMFEFVRRRYAKYYIFSGAYDHRISEVKMCILTRNERMLRMILEDENILPGDNFLAFDICSLSLERDMWMLDEMLACERLVMGQFKSARTTFNSVLLNASKSGRVENILKAIDLMGEEKIISEDSFNLFSFVRSKLDASLKNLDFLECLVVASKKGIMNHKFTLLDTKDASVSLGSILARAFVYDDYYNRFLKDLCVSKDFRLENATDVVRDLRIFGILQALYFIFIQEFRQNGDSGNSTPVERFFKICVTLPIELEMKVCNLCHDDNREFISTQSLDLAKIYHKHKVGHDYWKLLLTQK